MNLSNTIIPKSDQLNSDDLISGPLTIKIKAVVAGSTEQPVAINYEDDKGRPYKPSKSMRRVLIVAWGSESAAYIGRRLALVRNPAIRYGGDQVGGIEISHMSDISQPLQVALTVTRGKRKAFTVNPLPPEAVEHASIAIDTQSLIDIGDTKAIEGKDALRTWFESLPNASRQAIKDRLTAWKEKAL